MLQDLQSDSFQLEVKVYTTDSTNWHQLIVALNCVQGHNCMIKQKCLFLFYLNSSIHLDEI